MNATNQTIDTSDIDSLLDGTLDDLKDIPEFKPFPVGAHLCTINWVTKKVNERTAIELNLVAIATQELTNVSDTPLEAGAGTSVMFSLYKKDGSANDLAQGQWKALLTVLAQHLGTKTNRETMEASNGLECVVFTGIRADKRNPSDIKNYTTVENIAVV